MKPTKCQQPLKFVIVLKATRIQSIFKRSPTILIIWSRFLKLSIALCDFCWFDAVLHLQVSQTRQLAEHFTGKLRNIVVGQITEKTKP